MPWCQSLDLKTRLGAITSFLFPVVSLFFSNQNVCNIQLFLFYCCHKGHFSFLSQRRYAFQSNQEKFSSDPFVFPSFSPRGRPLKSKQANQSKLRQEYISRFFLSRKKSTRFQIIEQNCCCFALDKKGEFD